MNTWVKVARYNLVRPANYLVLLWILPFSFAVGAVTADGGRGHDAAGYLLGFFIYFAVLGMQTIGRSLPFGLTPGASHRSFYSGTALLGMTLALVSGLVLTALQAIERATGGWGLSMHFFRVPYLLNGPWYATWLTSAVGLFALFVYGMWYGIVHLRVGPARHAGVHRRAGGGAAGRRPHHHPPRHGLMLAFLYQGPYPGSLFSPPDQRASDADRDTAVDILCAVAADGRLTLTELWTSAWGRPCGVSRASIPVPGQARRRRSAEGQCRQSALSPPRGREGIGPEGGLVCADRFTPCDTPRLASSRRSARSLRVAKRVAPCRAPGQAGCARWGSCRSRGRVAPGKAGRGRRGPGLPP
jgi:hypothetical protein